MSLVCPLMCPLTGTDMASGLSTYTAGCACGSLTCNIATLLLHCLSWTHYTRRCEHERMPDFGPGLGDCALQR